MASPELNSEENCNAENSESKEAKIGRFVCSHKTCGKTFDRTWKLLRHTCTHTNERPFPCDFEGCTKAYQCRTHLNRHIKTFHYREGNSLQCSIPDCLTTFSTKSALKKHLKNHDKLAKYKCSVCDVTLLTHKRLQDHENAHKGILPYSCKICNSQWASRTLLRRHVRTHNKRKCSEKDCDVVTDTWHQLRTHMKLAHFVAYECAQCAKKFVNKYYLKEHVMHHLPMDDRPYIRCPLEPCDRIYYHARNLKHHMKVFHSQDRYFCGIDECRASYLKEEQLHAHRKRFHRSHSLAAVETAARMAEKSYSAYPEYEEETQVDSECVPSKNSSQYLTLVMSKDSL